MGNFYYEIGTRIGRELDAANAERNAARRAQAARRSRASLDSARRNAHEAARTELNRLWACGHVGKADYERRKAELEAEEEQGD